MTSTDPGMRVGGYRREVDQQKLGPALLIASSLVLAIKDGAMEPDAQRWAGERRPGEGGGTQCTHHKDRDVPPNRPVS